VVATLIVLALMFVLAYRTWTIFLNPMLALAGFSLYDGKLKLDSDEKEQNVLFTCRPLFGGRQVRRGAAGSPYLLRRAAPDSYGDGDAR
jgi:hypothetical protein